MHAVRSILKVIAAGAGAIALFAAVGAVAYAAPLRQDDIPFELLDMIDTLLRLSALAFLVIPITEVRRLLGGLPDIPLPSTTLPDGTVKENKIRAGRWVSFVVSGAVLAFGHTVGWLSAPDFSNVQAWLAIELAILAGVANIVYARWWKEQLGMDPDPAARPR